MAYIIVLDDGSCSSIEQKHKVELNSNSSWLSLYGMFMKDSEQY